MESRYRQMASERGRGWGVNCVCMNQVYSVLERLCMSIIGVRQKSIFIGTFRRIGGSLYL